MDPSDSVAKIFDVTPVRPRPVLAPRVPAITALATARRASKSRKKLKWRARDMQASLEYNLNLDVMNLHQEIQRLMEYWQVLQARTFNCRDDLDGYYVKTVMEYHRVFENGYRPGATLDGTQFVLQVMDEDIAIGRFTGREVLLHQWEQYTRALTGLELRYLHSRVASGEGQTIVTSYASCEYVITQDTLDVMFPDVMHQHPNIAAKILGRVFTCTGQFAFTFDTQTHYVVSFDFQLDLLETFAHLLRDPRDLCAIFQGARITEEFLIGDVTSYQEWSPQHTKNGGPVTSEVEEKEEPKSGLDAAETWH